MIPIDLLPPGYYDRAVIAGGFAACPILAGDMDVWVLRCTEPGYSRECIIEYWKTLADLKCMPEMLKVGGKWRRFEIEDETRSAPFYENERILINRVGKIFGHKPIHVLTTDAETPEQLVESFDISTHAIAIDTSGHIHTAMKFTTIRERPVIMHETPTTRPRLARITQRYGLPYNYKEETVGNCPF